VDVSVRAWLPWLLLLSLTPAAAGPRATIDDITMPMPLDPASSWAGGTVHATLHCPIIHPATDLIVHLDVDPHAWVAARTYEPVRIEAHRCVGAQSVPFEMPFGMQALPRAPGETGIVVQTRLTVHSTMLMPDQPEETQRSGVTAVDYLGSLSAPDRFHLDREVGSIVLTVTNTGNAPTRVEVESRGSIEVYTAPFMLGGPLDSTRSQRFVVSYAGALPGDEAYVILSPSSAATGIQGTPLAIHLLADGAMRAVPAPPGLLVFGMLMGALALQATRRGPRA
jgi:hypothetical protein